MNNNQSTGTTAKSANTNQSKPVNQTGNASTNQVEPRTLSGNHAEERMKVATISDRTRKLFVVKGKLLDVSNLITDVVAEMYGELAVDKSIEEEKFWEKLSDVESVIDEYLFRIYKKQHR